MKEKADFFFPFLNMLLRLYQTDMSLPVAHETGDIGVFSFLRVRHQSAIAAALF